MVCILGWQFSDFKSFSGFHKLDISKYSPGLYFIRGVNKQELRLGSNGAGKSSLLDSLSWCCTGRTADGLKTTDIKPWRGKGKTEVTTEFCDEDGVISAITKSTDPNRILLNGEPSTQEDIDNNLIPTEIFFHTVLFGQGQPLFLDLKPSEKMEVLNNALRLSRWVDRAEKASTKAKELDNKLSQENGRLVGLTSSKEETKDLLTKAKEQSERWAVERKQQLEETEKELGIAAKALEKVKAKQITADLVYDGAETELRALRTETKSLMTELSEAERQMAKAETEVSYDTTTRAQIENELKTLGKAKTCPTCGQPVKQSNLAEHRKELEARLNKPVKTIPKALVKKLEELRTRFAQVQKTEQTLCIKVDDSQCVLNQLNRELAEIEAKHKSLKTKVGEYQDENNPYQEMVQQLRRKNESLTGQIKTLEQEIVELSELTERTRFWVRGFRDVCLYIVDEFLQELELESNAILPEIGLVDWELKYAVERETKSGTVHRGLDVTVLSPRNTSAVKWESWSGGEGQRLRIAVSLALAEALLNQVGITINLQVLDEPTRHLSSEGVADICEFLSERAKRLGKVIFYVDHQSVESTHFAGVIEVIKSKAGSELRIV